MERFLTRSVEIFAIYVVAPLGYIVPVATLIIVAYNVSDFICGYMR